MTTTARDILAVARGLAGDLLFPGAMRVGGLDLAATCAVTEELASGCLTTTFVWMQNRGLVMTLAAGGTPAALRDRWLGPACRGELRGGITLPGLIPGPRGAAPAGVRVTAGDQDRPAAAARR